MRYDMQLFYIALQRHKPISTSWRALRTSPARSWPPPRPLLWAPRTPAVSACPTTCAPRPPPSEADPWRTCGVRWQHRRGAGRTRKPPFEISGGVPMCLSACSIGTRVMRDCDGRTDTVRRDPTFLAESEMMQKQYVDRAMGDTARQVRAGPEVGHHEARIAAEDWGRAVRRRGRGGPHMRAVACGRRERGAMGLQLTMSIVKRPYRGRADAAQLGSGVTHRSCSARNLWVVRTHCSFVGVLVDPWCHLAPAKPQAAPGLRRGQLHHRRHHRVTSPIPNSAQQGSREHARGLTTHSSGAPSRRPIIFPPAWFPTPATPPRRLAPARRACCPARPCPSRCTRRP